MSSTKRLKEATANFRRNNPSLYAKAAKQCSIIAEAILTLHKNSY